MTTDIHEPANDRIPVKPITRHNARNSPMDRKVAKGERKNLTRRVFLQWFHSSTHPATQTARKIRLSGNAKKSEGKAHMLHQFIYLRHFYKASTLEVFMSRMIVQT